MITIFTPSKNIYFVTDKTYTNKGTGIYDAQITTTDELQKKYHEAINKSDVCEIYFINPNLDKLLTDFSSMFKVIEAAGGLVKNNEGKWLFIYRNDKWDLPKGKIEKGESTKTAAVREVEEECGIGGLSIVKELPSTFHTYVLNDKNILKRTYWFNMNCSDTSELVPQTEEGITDVRWLGKNDLEMVVNNTYPSILQVLQDIL